MNKKCYKCKVIKPLDEFSRDKNRKSGRMCACKQCLKQYYEDNKERIRERRAKYYQENREEKLEWQKQYHQENKVKANERTLKRYYNDPVFALRVKVSLQVRKMLKSNNGSKQGENILQYLPYTIEQLKEHIEKQFEPGMTWDNHSMDGWHIDHIYPHSLLPYDSMNHPNFQKAWALENLQPLWAKENITKGNNIIGE